MTLIQIAINNIRRRKSKMFFILLSILIGVSTLISVYSVVETIKTELNRKMSEYGANIIITPDSGGLTFSYGGIKIPEVVIDDRKLNMDDVNKIILNIDKKMVKIISPKILGVIGYKNQEIIIAGSDLRKDFSIKPWLKLENENNKVYNNAANNKDGFIKPLLSKNSPDRIDFDRLGFNSEKVILGSVLAKNFKLNKGDSIVLNEKSFIIAGVLHENGTSEDRQVMMDLKVAQDILKRSGEISLIEISADYRQGGEEELVLSLSKILPQAKVTSLKAVIMGRDDLVSHLERFGIVVSVLIIIVGMLVVLLTMNSAVRERTRDIGIFRALGFRKTDIARIILLESIILSSIGGLCGYIIGTLLAKLATPYFANVYSSMPWRLDLVVFSIIIAIICGTIASIFPAIKASKLDPVEAIRFL